MGFVDGIAEPALRALYRYWAARRGCGRVPTVRDIDPLDLPPRVLPWLFLFRREGGRFRCILVGTGIVQLLGCDVTGRYLDDMPGVVDRPRTIALFEEAASTGLPIYCSGCRRVEPKAVRSFSRLLLPAGRDGNTVDHVFGMLFLGGANDGAPCNALPNVADGLLVVRRAASTDLYMPHIHEPAQRTHG